MRRKHSKRARDEPSVTLREIADYCSLYCIRPSNTFRSFYFWHKGTKYRVSDHPPAIMGLEDNARFIQVDHPMESLIEIHQAVINGYQIDNQGKVRRSA